MKRFVAMIIFMVMVLLMPHMLLAKDVPNIDPAAIEILSRMSEILGGARQFSVHNEATSDEPTKRGGLVQLSITVDILFRRPDGLRAVVRGDMGLLEYWYDGRQIAFMDVSRMTYAVAPVPRKIDDAIDHVFEKFGITIPLADFLASNPYQILTKNVEYGYYVGLHNVNGIACHHLAFVQDDIDWQIWIEDGPLPLPRKFIITYKQEEGHPQYTALLTEWNLFPGLHDSVFKFVPPSWGEEIEFAETQK